MRGVPIDFAAIAGRYRDPLDEAARRLAATALALVPLLTERADAAERRGAQLRHIPLLTYRAGALVVRVDGGPLAPGFGGRMVENLSYPAVAYRQEQAVWGVIGDLMDLVEAAADSSRRYLRASPEMFDPARGRPSDLFGQVLLLIESIARNPQAVTAAIRDTLALRREVTAALQQAGAALAQASAAVHPAPPSTAPPSPPPATAVTAATAPDTRSTEECLREITDLLPGLLLAVPAIGRALDVLGPPVDRMIREALLGRLALLERRAIALRRQVLGLIEDALRPGAALAHWIGDVSRAVVANVGTLAEILAVRVDELLGTLRSGFTSVFGGVSVLDELRAKIEAFEAAKSKVPGKTWGELFDDIARGDSGWLTFAEIAIRTIAHPPPAGPGMPPPEIPGAEQLDEVARALSILNRETLQMVGADRVPLRPVDFPDIGALFFGDAARNQRLLDAAGTFGSQAQTTVADIFGGLATMLEATAAAAARAGRGVGSLGGPETYARIARDARAHAERAYGGMRGHLRERIRDEDHVALALGDQLVTGAGAVAALTIPAYVGEVRDRLRRDEHRPTSPHILARRERVSRVRLPRLVVRAAGAPDGALADRVGERFRGAMRDAYRTGVAQLEVAAG